MTNAEWDAIIEEARKEEPLKKGQLKQNGVITWAAYSNGLLILEGNGRMEYEEYAYELDWNGYQWDEFLFQNICDALREKGKPKNFFIYQMVLKR